MYCRGMVYFPLRWEKAKDVCSHHLYSPSYWNETGKGNKKCTDWEERNKTVFAHHDNCLCRKLQTSTPPPKKKEPAGISKYTKVSRYKVNIQTSIAFLYSSNNWNLKFKMQYHLHKHSPKVRYNSKIRLGSRCRKLQISAERNQRSKQVFHDVSSSHFKL